MYFVIIDDQEDRWSTGITLDEAIDDFYDNYEVYPNFKNVAVIQGTKKKFKIDLVDANPKAAPKPVTKPAVKKTVSKSK